MWIPDSFSPHCLVRDCQKLLKKGKRHHCRACGRSICDKCCFKEEVPQFKGKKVRCCRMCKIPNTPTTNFPEVYDSVLSNWARVTLDEEGRQSEHRWHCRLVHPDYVLGPAIAMCEGKNEDKDYKPAYWIPIHNGSSIERQDDELVITSFSDANHFNARVKIESPGDVETWNAFLRLAKDSK